MAGRNDMWIHGVAAMVEQPELAEIHHVGQGTSVKQASGSNVIQMTIPTPTVIDGDEGVAVTKVHVHASLSGCAEIGEVEVWMGDNRISRQESVWRGPEVRESVYLGKEYPDGAYPSASGVNTIQDADGPIAVRLRVDFPTEGEIVLRGAGASYHE